MPTVVQNDRSDDDAGGLSGPSGGVKAAVIAAIPAVLSVLAWLLAPTLAAPSWVPFVRVIAFVVLIVVITLSCAYAIDRYRRRHR